MTRILTVAALVLGGLAPFAGSPYRAGHAALDVAGIARAVATERDHVTAVELAGWIRARKPGLQILDVTGSAETVPVIIPGAVGVDMGDLVASATALRPHRPTVVYSAGGAHGAQAWVLLRALGFRDVYFLQGGLDAWITEVLSPPEPTELSLYFGGEASGDPSMSVAGRLDVLRRRGC